MAVIEAFESQCSPLITLKISLEVSVEESPEHPRSRASLKATSAALGPALSGYAVKGRTLLQNTHHSDRCVLRT